MVQARFHAPGTTFEWFVVEGSSFGTDYMFYGYALGAQPGWGNFLLSHITSEEYPFLVRDSAFTPKPFSHISR